MPGPVEIQTVIKAAERGDTATRALASLSDTFHFFITFEDGEKRQIGSIKISGKDDAHHFEDVKNAIRDALINRIAEYHNTLKWAVDTLNLGDK